MPNCQLRHIGAGSDEEPHVILMGKNMVVTEVVSVHDDGDMIGA